MFKPWYKQLININGIKLKPSVMHKSQSSTIASLFAFLAIATFPQKLLKRDTDMVASYCIILHLIAMLLCLASYEQSYT